MIACFDMDGGRSGTGSGVASGHSGEGSDGGGRGAGRAGRRARAQRGGCSAGPVRVEPAVAGDPFAFGAPSVVLAGGPRPEDHPAGRTDDEIAALFARKRRERAAGIERVMEEARAQGRPVEAFVAAIKFDSEFAPRTTNRRQLLELGIDVPAGDALPAADTEVRRQLWTIVFGLARLGIFLTGTDPLDDREMLGRLCARVLLDEVTDIPPSAEMSEFIDLSPPLAKAVAAACAGTATDARDPDGLSGPFEFDPESDENELACNPPGEAGRTIRCDRDRFLPRPDRR